MRRINARFWDIINGGLVKITLKPGQSITHFRGGPTEEGWFLEETTWYYDPYLDAVRCHTINDGVDCDGRLSHADEAISTLEDLRMVTAKKVYWTLDGGASFYPKLDDRYKAIKKPRWETLESYQRDYAAEAAGY